MENNSISIEVFRVSVDGYLEMIFQSNEGWKFKSLVLEVKSPGEKKLTSKKFDLTGVLFANNNSGKFAVRVPLDKLGITAPSIYIAFFETVKDIAGVSENVLINSNIISVEEYIPDQEICLIGILNMGLENFILYSILQMNTAASCGEFSISAGKIVFRIGQIPNNGFLHFKAKNEYCVNNTTIKHNNEIINPNGLDYNIYNLNSNDTISFETGSEYDVSEGIHFKMSEEEGTHGYITYEYSESEPITEQAICSDVNYAYRCMLDDLFMHEGECKDIIPDELIRKYLILYGHLAALHAEDFETAEMFFQLMGNCFNKCAPVGRGSGSCCTKHINQYKPCNCGR